MLKLIWNIYDLKEGMWVKWVHTVLLKGLSLWEANAKVNDSWLWEKLLWVRDKFPNFFAKEIGNG